MAGGQILYYLSMHVLNIQLMQNKISLQIANHYNVVLFKMVPKHNTGCLIVVVSTQ